VTGGSSPNRTGYFIEPTIFANVKDDMVIAKEEIFGPVMQVLKYDDVEEVIQRANNTPYGLAAGIVTKSVDKALKLSERIDAGHVYINTYAYYSPYTPFGGFKDSGYGRELGEEALKSYMETKTVILAIGK
jgi:acyl-CoA reductase-like NAD-dependent aldehyde dehydrogenase